MKTNFIMKFIPNGISDGLLLSLMRFGQCFNSIKRKTVIAHRAHNQAIWDAHSKDFKENGFIEDQNKLNEMVYGTKKLLITRLFMRDYYIPATKSLDASGNVCELVALYNALRVLNYEKVSLVDLIEYFEFKHNGAIFNGNFGTSPNAIHKFLIQSGYNALIRCADKLNPMQYQILQANYKTFIFSTWNNENDASDFLHTMCITKENDPDGKDKFVIHNDYTKKSSKFHLMKYDSLQSAMLMYNSWTDTISSPVCIIAINKRDAH